MLGQLLDDLTFARRGKPQALQALSNLFLPIRHGCLSSRIDPGNTVQCGKKVFPGFALLGQDLLTGSGELVKPSSALSRLLDPTTVYEAPFFQAVEQRVERSSVELQHTIGALLY